MRNRQSATAAVWPGPFPLANPPTSSANPRAVIRLPDELGAIKGVLAALLVSVPSWMAITWCVRAILG